MFFYKFHLQYAICYIKNTKHWSEFATEDYKHALKLYVTQHKRIQSHYDTEDSFDHVARLH